LAGRVNAFSAFFRENLTDQRASQIRGKRHRGGLAATTLGDSLFELTATSARDLFDPIGIGLSGKPTNGYFPSMLSQYLDAKDPPHGYAGGYRHLLHAIWWTRRDQKRHKPSRPGPNR
jgi:hypothetical protein